MPEYTEEQNRLWEEVQKLGAQRDELKKQLEDLYETKYNDRQLEPGRTDAKAFEELSYTTRECKDPDLAEQLQRRIDEIQEQINPLVDQWNHIQDNKLYEERQKQISAQMDQKLETAKEQAQHRYSKMSKLKKAIATITGQRSKFERLISNAANLSPEEKQESINQIDQFYRGK